ncbi:hypothetical protein CTZ27_16310 [Streptomyces griseocarneus]|nr:hypothetical protein CTZ27_16310 [Streptomyces griseocarneus]
MAEIQKISDPAFQTFEGQIRETSEALSGNLRALADVLATVGSAWTGAGAQAFRTAQTALNEDHDALRALIDGIHDAVAMTRKMSHANDADIVARFRQIDVNGSAAGGHLGSLGKDAGLSAGLDSKIDAY